MLPGDITKGKERIVSLCYIQAGDILRLHCNWVNTLLNPTHTGSVDFTKDICGKNR